MTKGRSEFKVVDWVEKVEGFKGIGFERVMGLEKFYYIINK